MKHWSIRFIAITNLSIGLFLILPLSISFWLQDKFLANFSKLTFFLGIIFIIIGVGIILKHNWARITSIIFSIIFYIIFGIIMVIGLLVETEGKFPNLDNKFGIMIGMGLGTYQLFAIAVLVFNWRWAYKIKLNAESLNLIRYSGKTISSFKKIERHTGSITTIEGLYEGELINSKPNGKGVFKFNDGGRYEGDFVDGKFTGKGVMLYTFPSSGYRYEGDFVDGNRHGKGVYTFPSGKKYIGDFVDNDIHGFGEMFDENGKLIEKGRWNHFKYVGNR
jgi:hypothetical protein